jgi:hypothetical protein
MGHFDGTNYTSSVMAFLEANEKHDLEEENKKLKDEIKELKSTIKVIVLHMEEINKGYNSKPIPPYVIKYAKGFME